MKAVIYARYSGDKQRETSIDDQVRNCSRFIDRDGFSLQRIFADRAISGSIRNRPEYQAMLKAANEREFEVLLIDDLSRLSRDDYEMKGVLRKLSWNGIRVVGVSDGYDSQSTGNKIFSTVKGLMNEVFLDDLRARTHRGMSGQAIKGYNCGGRTFGYRNVPIEDATRSDAYGRPAVSAVRYEIDDTQATIVREIYAWYADGHSYKWIASELNRRGVRASRGGTWAVSAIKVILENCMYEGKLVWNRREWVRHPDTGRRMYKERSRDQWIESSNPELVIVAPAIVGAVRRRQRRNHACRTATMGDAPAHRYLFSGLMSCAECGGNFTIVASGRYGCASYKTRGSAVCSNSATVSRTTVEARLLRNIKKRLLGQANLVKFKSATTRLIEEHNSSNRRQDLERQLSTAERTRLNLLAAIKQGILTSTTKEALQAAEAEVSQLKSEIQLSEQRNVSGMLPRAMERYQQAVIQLERTVHSHVEPAREILKFLIGERIRIHRRGEYLEAEIPHDVPAVVIKSLNSRFDLAGCGGPQRYESTFVPLLPLSQSVSEPVVTGRAVQTTNTSSPDASLAGPSSAHRRQRGNRGPAS